MKQPSYYRAPALGLSNSILNEANKFFFGTEDCDEVVEIFQGDELNESEKIEEKATVYLESIVNSSKHNPDVYDDTFEYDVEDNFARWQNDFGEYDDTYEYIKKYTEDGHAIAGWKSETSFKDTEKFLPKKIKELIRKGKYSNPYKRDTNKMEVWETKDEGLDIKVLRFKQYRSDYGRYYAEYWYMISIEGY